MPGQHTDNPSSIHANSPLRPQHLYPCRSAHRPHHVYPCQVSTQTTQTPSSQVSSQTTPAPSLPHQQRDHSTSIHARSAHRPQHLQGIWGGAPERSGVPEMGAPRVRGRMRDWERTWGPGEHHRIHRQSVGSWEEMQIPGMNSGSWCWSLRGLRQHFTCFRWGRCPGPGKCTTGSRRG